MDTNNSKKECPECGGEGYVYTECSICDGVDQVEDEEALAMEENMI